MKNIIRFALLITIAMPAAARDVDPSDVDRAIEKGARWLLGRKVSGSYEMLALLTLIHAREPRKNYADLIERALDRPLTGTYTVSLTAMALHELLRTESDLEKKKKYYRRLLHCAQFLVDNQTAHGQWRYGEAVPLEKIELVPKGTATKGSRKPTRARHAGIKDARYEVRKRFFGYGGDNSCTQYAALGIRACIEAGIRIPMEVLDRAVKYLEAAQGEDGGWNYGGHGSTADGLERGSMTAGSLASLAIFKYLARLQPGVKVRFIIDEPITKGAAWIDVNFTVKTNPRAAEGAYHYYYLYALERVGMVLNRKRIGKHDWYEQGARYLLQEQKDDGHWISEKRGTAQQKEAYQIRDTCFAILFLRKSTRPLATEGRRR